MNDRRNFLKNLARLTLAGGVVGGTAHLATRRPKMDRQTHICINQGICRGCGNFKGCGLPQALSARAAMKHQSGNSEKAS